MIYEIVILAMIAAFLGLRLYSVLGRRAEHEEESVPTRFERGDGQGQARPAVAAPADAAAMQRPIAGFAPAIEDGLRAIVAAERRFDLLTFLEGAKGAYGMVLEAFWRGDRETLAQLCDKDVYDSFDAAIALREEAGETLDNRLIRIEDTTVRYAALEGRTARIAVRFVADIASVTRNRDGAVIAGSLDDAIEICDVWTFCRNLDSTGPDWLLDETDEG